MEPLQRSDLWSLEQYSQEREAFRKKVLEHKKHRYVFMGDHLTLTFEDRLTIQYQVQEMLRVEKIFEAEDIEDELSAYNPMIPEGRNLKATMMVEYEDPEERRRELAKLVGLENQVWLQVEGFDKVVPIADEDLDRTTEDKTSAVHFLRFEFDDKMIEALKSGAALTAGSSHPQLDYSMQVPDDVRQALVEDFD